MIYEKCRDILLRECALIKEAVAIQEKIRLAVTNKELIDFEGHINEMNAIEEGLFNLENEREQLFAAFEALLQNDVLRGKRDAKGRFYALASHLPENQRNELTSIYRRLKMESIRLRAVNEGLMAYLSTVKLVLNEFFDCVYPERSRKTYTKEGTRLTQDMRSMVVNQSF